MISLCHSTAEIKFVVLFNCIVLLVHYSITKQHGFMRCSNARDCSDLIRHCLIPSLSICTTRYQTRLMDILRDHGFLLTNTSTSINVNLGADIFLGVTLILCFIVGVPANLISFKFFVSKPKPKDLCTCIYMLITISDVVICTMTLVPAVSYLNDRSPKLFSLSWVCRGWGAFWRFFPPFLSSPCPC